MDDEVYAFAVKSALNEIRNICPEIISAFMFKEDGEIIAGDDATSEKTMVRVVDSFDTILEKADAIGGVDSITFEGSKSRLNMSCMNEVYLVTVASEKADMKYVNATTRVIIPTVLKLLEKICSSPIRKNSPLPATEPKFQVDEEIKEPPEEPTEKSITEEFEELPKPEIKPPIKPETSLPEPPVNQLIVENLGGLLVPSDIVRIDNEILTQWSNLYEGSKIEEVEIGTFDGKTTRCKVKPIKDSKYEGKGIIQMPEKVQLALEIKKGELVRARPIIEGGG
ncbi:hypothetical protein HXY32_07535 [Candidatus Bathyarchaeota archaeon]|nr:hypothetical protein [Candidatus Bathyarchaeota archaeon]